MNHLSVKLALAPLTLLCCVGCVNDDYDLSDIDTTSRVNVEDLVIPVNIETVTLGDIITFDEDSKIKPVTIDGREFYALIENGDFESEPIEIAKVTAPAPVVEPTDKYLDKYLPGSLKAPSVDPSSGAITYVIKEMGDDIHYNAGHVDDAIIALDHVAADLSFTMTLNALNIDRAIKSVTFDDIVILLPKGLDATSTDGEYDPATGLWTIGHKVVYDTKTAISIHATGIDFVTAGVKLDANHEFTYDGEFKILSGFISILPNSTVTLPETLHLHIDYGMTDLTASAFSGTINYKLDGLDIAPVSLNDIPEFLAGNGTNIELVDPQIYLQVNNPVADNSLVCSTGLTLEAIRTGMPTPTFSIDEGSFTIGCDKGNNGRYNFVLAPDANGYTAPTEYSSDLTFVKFSSLGRLLALPQGYPSAGLPESIGITLDNPQIPTQHVTDFALGRTLPAVKGNYQLLAPLALTESSQIVYTDIEDGWNDDDIDAITITKLSLSATVTNNCPVAVELFAYPIDINGNRISGVEIRSSHVDANSANSQLTIEMTGTVQHFDGVEFVAVLSGSADGQALTPSQTIELTDIRARVSGYYEKEL